MSDQRLSEAEFDTLINGAIIKPSIQVLSRLTGFASDDTCVPTQYFRILSIMYHQLDANKIPSGAVGKDIQVQDLDIPIASLAGLGTTLPVWLNHSDLWQQLPKGLCTNWPDIRRWTLFLYKNVIVQEGLDVDVRYACKTAVLQFLGLVRDRLLLPWSKCIPVDREVMKMICDLWFIETWNSRFSSWSDKGNTQRESAVFNSCFLIAYEFGTSIDWSNLLSLFQGNPEFIATVALCHLDREISHDGNLDLNCVAWDLHIITVFAFQEDIRLALMRQGAIKAASEILALVVDREWEGETRVLAARCMINAIVLLRSRIEEMDALPFLSQALQRGIIASLLKCEALLPFAQQPPHQHLAVLVGEILPGYTVYRSVLYPVVLAVDLAVGQRLDARLSKGGELYKAWKRLKDTVYERRRLVRPDVANKHIQTCQNDTCSKASRIGRFKRCGGCLHAYYCSRKCQRYDWQDGKHKQYCAQIHQRFVRTSGQMSAVRSKDLKFFDQIILAELKKHRERLNAHSSKVNVVELNLVGGQVSIILDARGTKADPFGTNCGCEMFANARWKLMAEMVREGKKRMVLVRAFIPGGMSRKIVLQAIPLSMVLAGGRTERKSDVMEKYQFNLIFTCCGNNSKRPQ